MARNKKNKKTSGKNQAPKKPASTNKIKPEIIQAAVQPIAETRSSPKTSSTVRLSTCIAGMFMAFVLGSYLGSFLPGILSGMEKEKQIIAGAEQKPSLPAAPIETKEETETPMTRADMSQSSTSTELSRHIRHMEQEVLAHPEDAKIWSELGNGYFDNHEPQKAISAYVHSLKISPDNPDVWTDLGIMYREIKDYDKALECFRKASTQNPKHINALFNEGVVLSTDLNRKSEAINAWKRILDINPQAATPNGQKIADLVRELR